ncbi:MAG: CDGSH iron-sulfur domain-containing protein [Bacteroidetes bacterium]|nr:CDGSH iron-sulfur domain-containing protein [Bacteroidota bacterium]
MADPKIADRKPRQMTLEPGIYYWCACGQSKKQPFCDGSHHGSEFTPKQVKIEETQEVWWCLCKHTGNKPFCDGTHRNV